MKYINILMFAFLILIGNQTNAQFGAPSIIPPSPEAAAISRYGDVPVSLYTGTPQIEIPFYTLRCGSLTLPVSLSYFASGIKVEDYPTWAGIGWTLNAGGVITRTKRGGKIGVNSSFNSSEYLPIAPDMDGFNNVVSFADPLSAYKTESDIFFYNFNGYSGSFYVKNGEAILKKYDDLKIEFVYDPAISDYNIIVTTQEGTKYYFDRSEINDFYLQRIVSANNNDIIYFEYTNGDDYYRPARNSKYYNLYNALYYTNFEISSPDVDTGNNAESSGLLLKKISTSKNDSIVFKKKSILVSSPYSRQALESIIIYSSLEKVKSFNFNTNNIETIKPYSHSIVGYPAVGSLEAPVLNYRLYLDGLEEVDKYGTTVSNYQFEYYGRTANGKDSLANRLSFAQDLGGYYNGQDDNIGLIPTFDENLDLDPILSLEIGSECIDYDHYKSDIHIEGANRGTNFQCMRMGTLKSIKYPTGGSANFHFSQKFDIEEEPTWGLNIDRIDYLNANGELLKQKRYEYSFPTQGYKIPSSHYFLFNNTSSEAVTDNIMSYYPFCECAGLSNPDCNNKVWKWTLELCPCPKEDLGLNEGPLFGYGQVKEYETGNGYTIYDYSTDGGLINESGLCYEVVSIFHFLYPSSYIQYNNHTTWNSWPFGPLQNNSWKLGTLLNKKVYNNSNVKLQEIAYDYSFVEMETIPNIKVLTVAHDFFYFYYQYNLMSSWIRLNGITETLNGVTTTTTFEYNSADHKQLTNKTITQSDGVNLYTEYKYPNDFAPSSAICDSMVQHHIISPEIEKTVTKGTFSEKTIINYYNPSGTNYVPQTVQQIIGTTTTTKLTYNSYDDNGNVTQYTGVDGVVTSFLWDATKTYVMAKVEGASFSQISSHNGQVSSYNSKTLWTDLNDDVPGAMVTTYSYQNLIGMTEQTTVNGTTTKYIYDNFGRLAEVKDDDDKLLKKYEYNYANN